MTEDGGVSDGAREHLAADTDTAVEGDSSLTVAVIGAGAVGTTAAYALARAGADVTLYDRGSVASGASGRAAGICYDAFADSLEATLAAESIERFRALSGEETFPFVECPYVWFAREGDDDRIDAVRRQVRRMQENGVVVLEVDGSALGERFPSLRTDDIAVAGIAGAAGYTDPARYTDCMAAAATGAGARLEAETDVAVRTTPPRVVLENGAGREFDAVLVAAGARTKRLLADAGVSIAMKPYRVQALIGSGDFEEPMWYDATDECYARPHLDGLLAGNGAEHREADPARYDRDADPEFAATLETRIRHRLPDVELGLERAWAGLCTATPDRDPLVGRLREGVYVATGFQGHGFMRAPAIGERIAREISGGSGIDAYDPTRFAGDEEFDVTEGTTLTFEE
ncbi:FAD-binding oxidoreductase [Natrarchaeobius halalkaliphilus]|uniref:FAD-binding oxidoreductase n=1 Tax=Natrarchaeobius halalkaliphilus TaxID=1679091 RepID=A0A3N6P1I9_9EURY|nr:FAD-binding oxidoreductase [Natrarchaeobius halalkaliphilus]RQG88945.1 FAD-binding oxidoreductase [Natrarchaeobius halalkaliphilus]